MENKLEKIGQNSFMDNFVKTDDILKDMCGIIESSQKAAYQAVNTLLVQRNWLIGYRIAEEELGGDERSEYGLEVIKKISKELTQRYGKGYDRSNLYHCLKFYKTFPEIVDTACRQSGVLLSWSHYRTLLQVKDPEARDWYEKEAAEQTWSVRTLQRNISSQYYYRMLGTQKKELVESEMKELTAPYQNDKLEFIKNPVVAEFLGFSQNTDFTESDLEKSILSNLQKFLMELGKGYAFVARQQHIHTEKQDYYIDLVFYNYILKCFVLIDLKTEKITHQDVGQMDMYIRITCYPICRKAEGFDFFLYWVLVGCPYGIRKMCMILIPKNFGIAGSIGILALNCIVGGLIGGVVVILRMVMVLMEIIKIISDTSGHDVQRCR